VSRKQVHYIDRGHRLDVTSITRPCD